MISFGQAQQRFQRLSQDNSAAALDFFKDSYNVGQRTLEVEIGSFYTEETYTDTTVASQAEYKTPDQFVRLKKAYVTVGTKRYVLIEVHDEDEWQALQMSSTTQTSNISRFVYIRRDIFEIYPKPADAGNTITLIYEASSKELSFDDYNEGLVTTLANGGVAVTLSGSTLTAAMAGRYFKVNSYPVYYKIASFGTTTTMTLDKKYTGISISGGSESYVIGEMPRTPESTHQIPIWHGLMDYYQGFKQNKDKAIYYKTLFESDLKRAKVTHKRRYTSNYIPGRRVRAVNPNHYPDPISEA